MNKTITWKLTHNSTSRNLTHLISAAIRGGDIMLLGNINGMFKTCGDSNTFFETLIKLVAKLGNRIHMYIDSETNDEMRKDRMTNRLMNKPNVIIHIVRDWTKFKIGEEMKFSGVVMNPPYCSGLHLKILQGVIPAVDFEHGGQIECIHPAAWMQFPTRERPDFMNSLIEDFDMIERKDANEMFDIDGGDLVVTSLKKGGLSFSGNAVSDKFFCCFKYNSRFADNWKIVKSIYEKVVAKCPVGTFKKVMTNNSNSTYSLRMNYARTQTCGEWSKGGTSGSTMKPENCFKITSKLYETACKNSSAACVGFLNFNTEQERYNAWQSYLTKFARFCIAMDESTKLAPYMGNYQQPWDDKRFYEYFELTDEEIAVIEDTIK